MKTKLYLTLIFLIMSFLGHAQPGDIDITFNGSGIGAFGVTNPLSPNPSQAQKDADGNVYNSRVYEDGVNKDKIVIVGRFLSFNREVRRYIARLNPDGSVDTSFSGPIAISGYIYTLEILPDGKILIAGGFSTGGYKNFARLNENGSLDTTFNPGTSPRGGTSDAAGNGGVVHAIAVQTTGTTVNNIVIGGDFNYWNGAACRLNMQRLDANGNQDTAFNAIPGYVNGEIRALAFQGNKIIVGGFFTGYSYPAGSPSSLVGKKRSRVLRMNADGTFDDTFNPHGGANGNNETGATGGTGTGPGVYDVYVMPPGSGIHANRIYVVGKFTKYNNVSKVSIVRLLSEGGLDSTWNPGLDGFAVEEVASTSTTTGYGYCAFSIKAQPDGNILIGGNFRQYNGEIFAKGLIRLKPGTSASPIGGARDTNFITGTGFIGGTNVFQGTSIVRDIMLQSDGKIIVGGDFEQYNTTTRRMLARIKTRECIKAGVYSNGTWSEDGIPTSNDFYMAIASGTFTIPTGTNMQACELEVKTGATLIIQPGASLTVKGIVMNNGTFTVENTGSLVQVKEDTKNADLGAGTFTMKRAVTQFKPFDFVYWSSPVEDQILHDLSPLTRFDKYYKFNTASNAWQVITDGLETMVEAKGYIARAGTDITSSNSIFNAAFIGRPHNGKITIPMVKSGVNDMNLIGNPYPSAIDAKLFLAESTSNDANISPIIYLWSHATPIAASGNLYAYSSSDYIAYNKVGGVMTNPTGVPFQGKIGAGQAFFVKAINPVDAVFTNTMRLTDNNTQFYKNAATTQDSDNRIWLDLTNEQGAFKQTLIGFSEGATNGIDRAYDGIGINGNSFVNFYSIVDSNKLVIQGRALPFDANQAVPLGYSTTVAGTFKISLHQFDGLFQNQNVYLLDKLTNTVQDIKATGYTFNTEVGTFDNRFELKFTNAALGTKDAAMADQSAVVFAENHKISIQSTESISSVAVYDLTGKLLYTKNGIDAVSFSTETINAGNQVLMVQITFKNNAILTKKVLVN